MTARALRVGDKVTSCVVAQGLEPGEVYTIHAVRRQRTLAGTIATVTVQRGERLIDVRNPSLVLKPARIEAHGVKGLQNRAWRRTFASAEELSAWCERYDAAVLGQRYVDARGGEAR